MKKRFIPLLLTLLSLFLLTGCWEDDLPEENPDQLIPFEEEQEEAPDTSLPVNFSLSYAPEQTLDPINCPDGMQQVLGSLLYEGLFRLDHQFRPQPVLCSSYDYNPESFTYTFHLRPDIQFSDGTPLTGNDVKATLNRARKSARYSARLYQVTRITSSDSTVTVSLSGPNAAFPALLDIPIVKAGTEKQAAPVGTGPYLLSPDAASPQLVINQLWWQGAGQPVDRINLTEASDWETMLYRFTSHDVQLITADLIGEESTTTTGNISFLDTDTTTLQFIGCNTRRAPLDDAGLRHALWLSFNRSTVISAFLSGHGQPAQFPVSPVTGLYPTDLELRYAKEAFPTALESSSYRKGRTLTLLVNAENPFKISVADYIARCMTSGGVPVTVKALPWENYLIALRDGNYDLYYGEVRLTADWNLKPLLGTGGSLNFSGWADPMTDQLLASFAASDDPAQAMKALCSHLKTQAPILPVCFTSTSVLVHSDVVENLHPTATEPFYDLKNCEIHLRK